MHFDDRDECVKDGRGGRQMCHTQEAGTGSETCARERERQTERKRLGRKQMTLNRWGIGGEGRRRGNKREAKRAKGGAAEGYLLVFSLVLIPFCA